MNPRQFNGIYRPLVKAAWLHHCEATGTAPNSKDAKDIWYRQTLHDLTKGMIHSTKDISAKMQQFLIDSFRTMTQQAPAETETILITGWSQAQIARFHDLSKAAWLASKTDGVTNPYIEWIEAILKKHHIEEQTAPIGWHMPNKKISFDKIMAGLAMTANDQYWIMRTSEQGEIRLRFQLRRYLVDLDYLTKTTHTWEYVRGIYKQSRTLPKRVEDCPAEILWKVLAMLDTHIRRLCKDLDIRPMELPTRAHPASDHPHIIQEEAAHIHIGHSLEHIPNPVHVDAQDVIPF